MKRTMIKQVVMTVAFAFAAACGNAHTLKPTGSAGNPNGSFTGSSGNGNGNGNLQPTTYNTAVPQPQKNWRAYASQTQAQDSQQEFDISPLTSGGDGTFEPTINPNDPNPFFLMQVSPAASGGNVMFTYGGLYGIPGLTVLFEEATETTAGQAPTSGWTPVETQNPNQMLMRFVFKPQASVWYRVTLQVPSSFARPGQIDMVELGLYDLGGSTPKDYWIVTGASLEVQTFLNFTFKAAVQKAYPGFDPVVFNEATGGWYSADLVSALPGILARHPEATYVTVDIGGNDVNYNRPYPGGATTLENNLKTIIAMIQQAGKVPILGRLTYRAYPTNSFPDGFPCPPEDNGSGPYVMQVFDPLIKLYTPHFWDSANNRGLVDGYDFTMQNPNYLMSDGIHFTAPGATAWENYWVNTAGSVVYGAAPQQ